MSLEVALLLSGALLISVVVALFSKSVSVSLIALFYASLALGITFAVYGSTLLGLLEIITFAGAVTVLLLTAVLMTGEANLDIGASKTRLILVALSISLVAIASFFILSAGLPATTTTTTTTTSSVSGTGVLSPSSLLQFVWQFRPWDLLILLVIFASAMLVVTNLFSEEAA